MKTLDEIRSGIRQHQGVLLERFGLSVTGVFGSCVRREQKCTSDLDVLVDILRPISVPELVGAKLYLSDVLGVDVDVIPRPSLREELRDGILSEAVAI